MSDSEHTECSNYSDGSTTEYLGYLTTSGDSGIEFDRNRTLVRTRVLLSRERRHFLHNLRQQRFERNRAIARIRALFSRTPRHFNNV